MNYNRRATDNGAVDIRELLFQIEKNQILTTEQLKNFTERMDRHGKNYEDMTERIENVSRGFNDLVIGDGKNKGAIERLRILEDTDAKRNKYTAFAWCAIIGLMVKNFWEIIFKH